MDNGGKKMRKKIIYNPATNKFENMDPDVPAITKRLNQFRRKDDQLPTSDRDWETAQRLHN
jgi:hypothetical protein